MKTDLNSSEDHGMEKASLLSRRLCILQEQAAQQMEIKMGAWI